MGSAWISGCHHTHCGEPSAFKVSDPRLCHSIRKVSVIRGHAPPVASTTRARCSGGTRSKAWVRSTGNGAPLSLPAS